MEAVAFVVPRNDSSVTQPMLDFLGIGRGVPSVAEPRFHLLEIDPVLPSACNRTSAKELVRIIRNP